MTAVANKTEEIPISEFCQTGSGGTPSRSKAARYFGGSIPWVKSGELRESVITTTEETITADGLKESAAKLLPANTLLVALYGATVGRIGILGIEAATNQAVCYIIPDERRADRRYLYYALRSKVPVWLSQRVGGGQPNISQGIIKDTKIPLPPLSEQKRIADILDKADAIRRKRQEAIDVTESFRTDVLFDLFNHDFGSFSEVLAATTMPIGWRMCLLDDVANVIDCKHRTPEYSDDGYPVVRPRDVRENGIDFESCIKTTEREFQDLVEKRQPQVGDIVYSRNASFGEASIVARDVDFAIGQDVCLLVPTEISPVYLHRVLCSPLVKQQLAGKVSGTTFKRINLKDIRKLRIPVAPREAQERFAKALELSESALQKARFHQRHSIDLFNSLVQRAFKGEL